MIADPKVLTDQAFQVGRKILRNATVLPPDQAALVAKKNVFNGGVYDSDGNVVTEGNQIGLNYRQQPDDLGTCSILRTLSGTHLYAGLLRMHFGNFLMECLGRLWGSEGSDISGIVFAASIEGAKSRDPEFIKNKSDVSRLPKFIGSTLNILAPGKNLAIVSVPTRIENLYVPTQLTFNTGDLRIGGHSIYRRFTNDRIKSYLDNMNLESTIKKIYVSRSQLGHNKAYFILENALDNFLRQEGYHILYPERTSIEEQCALYSGASEILFSEGSATHLFALCVKPHQRVGIILRRWPADPKFQAELEISGCNTVYSFPSLFGRIAAVTVNSQILPRSKTTRPHYSIFHVSGTCSFRPNSSRIAPGSYLNPRKSVWPCSKA